MEGRQCQKIFGPDGKRLRGPKKTLKGKDGEVIGALSGEHFDFFERAERNVGWSRSLPLFGSSEKPSSKELNFSGSSTKRAWPKFGFGLRYGDVAPPELKIFLEIGATNMPGPLDLVEGSEMFAVIGPTGGYSRGEPFGLLKVDCAVMGNGGNGPNGLNGPKKGHAGFRNMGAMGSSGERDRTG